MVCQKESKFLYKDTDIDYSLTHFGPGCYIMAVGTKQERPFKKGSDSTIYQPYEILVKTITSYSKIDQLRYPMAKTISTETLRGLPYLRQHHPVFKSVLRVRSHLQDAIHSYMQSRSVIKVDTPIITGDDCEGAGEIFMIEDSAKFFDRKDQVGLTVSGQLHGECAASGLKDIYTFGPTFRAEHSQTSRHAAEFWMVEPELSFIDFKDLQKFTVEFLLYIVKYIKEHCLDDLKYLERSGYSQSDLIAKLDKVIETKPTTITYREALVLLVDKLGYTSDEIYFGMDLGSEMEKKITKHFDGLVVVTHYPTELKSFYMLEDRADSKVVEAMDILAPGIGEIVGDSMRESDYYILKSKMASTKVDIPWYLELRKDHCIPHGGFGLGFERMVMYVTGMSCIHDVTFMPRAYKRLA